MRDLHQERAAAEHQRPQIARVANRQRVGCVHVHLRAGVARCGFHACRLDWRRRAKATLTATAHAQQLRALRRGSPATPHAHDSSKDSTLPVIVTPWTTPSSVPSWSDQRLGPGSVSFQRTNCSAEPGSTDKHTRVRQNEASSASIGVSQRFQIAKNAPQSQSSAPLRTGAQSGNGGVTSTGLTVNSHGFSQAAPAIRVTDTSTAATMHATTTILR